VREQDAESSHGFRVAELPFEIGCGERAGRLTYAERSQLQRVMDRLRAVTPGFAPVLRFAVT
jgi:hypothetical protein